MSADGFKTKDPYLAAAIAYLYGFDCLTAIRNEPDERGVLAASFELDIASNDGAILVQEFKSGLLAITDLMSWVKCYSSLTRILRDMRRSGDVVWHSPSWLQGRG